MGQSILLKRSAIPGKKPSANSLNLGEIALNTYDGRIFFKRSGSVESVQEVITTNAINTGSINLYGGVNNQNYLLNITGYNDYFQGIYLQNLSNSVSASSDVAIYNNNGTSYVDIGINSTTYQSSSEAFTTLGGAGDAYIYSAANNLYIGNASSGKEVTIFNGGFDTNENAKIKIHDQGSIVINRGQSYNPTYPEALVINAASGSDFNLITAYNDVDNYSQINNQNLNSGSDASSDFVATADNGNEQIHYVNLGINSSGYNAGIVGTANDAYLINAGKDFYIGTLGDNYYNTNPNSNLYLFTNDGWQNPEIMISGSHVIGFGTTNVTNGYKYEFDGGDIKINNNVLILGTLYATASNAVSASYAVTASSADDFIVRGTLTAQTIVVQTITSSTDFVTGSTRFGSLPSNTHQFTGSVSVTGSLAVVGNVGITGSTTLKNVSGTGSISIAPGSDSLLTLSGFYNVGQTNLQLSSGGSDSYINSFGAGNRLIITNNSGITFTAYSSATQYMHVGSGGVIIGGNSTTPTARLDVSGSSRFAGNMIITGSGNTNATNALNVQNSDSVSIMSFRNDGNIYADGTNFVITKYTAGGTTLTISNTGHNGATGISTTSAIGLSAASSLGVSTNNPYGASVYAAGGAQVGSGNISLGLLSNRALISAGAGTTMHTSSMLQIDSTNRGFLPPRMTAAQRIAIGTPARGLVVYDTDSATEGIWFYNSGSIPGWQEVLTNSGSQSISGSITATSFIGDGSGITNIPASSVTGLNLYRIASGSVTASVEGGSFTVNSNTEISGTLKVSSSISASNINVGVPTSNDWGANLQGSYFNNFTTQTNVSEILRFIAGLLSSSAPDTSPNTKTFGSVSATALNTTTGTALVGRIPQSSTNSTILYLNSKGFATAGSTIFSGITPIYTANYGYNYTSVASGTTTVSSSADAQLFGLGNLSSGNPTSFNVSGSFTFRFKDNSTKTDTATSASQVLLTQTGAGTTNGVSLAKINTINTAVIPPAYQDGKFASTLTQYLYSGSVTAISASGYYHISASVRISSGSSTYSTATSTNAEIFYAPLATIATNVPVQTVYTASASTVSYVTAASRSLSGAPYLNSSTYIVSSSLSGAFAPLYFNATIGAQTFGGTGITQTSGVTSVLISSGLISTANAVYDSTNTTVRATSTIPFETDLIRLNGLYTFGGANITNITQTAFTPTTFTVSAAANNYNGGTISYPSTISYHVAGTFAQPAGSGSLAYYTRTQGADTATTSGSSNSEPFTGENYRIQLTDAILSFTGLQWSTAFGLYNLSGNDLQVKPGYLVKPGGTYGYWLADPDTTKTYKYYVRQITTNGGTKTSMTLNVGQALVNWGATTNNAIGALVLFQSSKTPTFGTARLYDPSDLLNNFVATKTANTNGQNPFGTNFDLYGNTGGSLATTTYTIPLRSADGMTLDSSNTNIYVILRYNGDPTPITSMTVTFA